MNKENKLERYSCRANLEYQGFGVQVANLNDMQQCKLVTFGGISQLFADLEYDIIVKLVKP